MKVIIRADASVEIGSGHLMRCMTLAGLLRENGAEVLFVCRELPGNMCEFTESKGFVVFRLPYETHAPGPKEREGRHSHWLGAEWEADAKETTAVLEGMGGADWVVVDHYALDRKWESRIRPYAGKVMVIDDLADRAHDCDLLLDQNLYEGMERRYDGLVPAGCVRLLGPRYALLRPEFVEARKTLRRRDGQVRRILVFFGGSDPSGETEKAIEAISKLGREDIAVDVVVGASNERREEIKNLCSDLPGVVYHLQVDNMAELMARADLALGAGGTTTWERCCLGLPALMVILAENQSDIVRAVASVGAAVNLGWSADLTSDTMTGELRRLIEDHRLNREAGDRALAVMDGAGFDWVRRHLTAFSEDGVSQRERYRLRPVEEKDLEMVLAWRNSPRVQMFMFTDRIISMEEHREWYLRLQVEGDSRCLIFESLGKPLGVVKVDQVDLANGCCLWGFYIGDTDAPRGSGMIMGFLGLEYIFETLQMRNVIGEVFAFNKASVKFHKKLGFKEKVRGGKRSLKDGVYKDVLSFTLLVEDWLKEKACLEVRLFGAEGEA